MSMFTSPSASKYNNSRLCLLLVVIFSVVNIFAISYLDMYFLFSAYLPQVFMAIGSGTRLEGFAFVMSIVYLIPYLVCYLLSKKRVGWMIGATVLFAVDSIFFLIDLPAYLAYGDFSFIIDLIFRIYIFVSLFTGIRQGKKMKEEDAAIQENGGDTMPIYDQNRQLTLRRKKTFVGCAVAMVVYVNGQEIGRLKNGETDTFMVPSHPFELGVSYSNGMSGNSMHVEANGHPLSYQIVTKMGFSVNTLEFEPMDD